MTMKGVHRTLVATGVLVLAAALSGCAATGVDEGSTAADGTVVFGTFRLVRNGQP